MSLKEIVAVFVLVSFGVGAGVFMTLSEQGDETTFASDGNSPTAGSQPTSDMGLNQKVAALESQLSTLVARVEELEAQNLALTKMVPVQPAVTTESALNSAEAAQAVPRGRRDNGSPDQMISNLVAAGVDRFMAEDIVRRQSEVELKRLELRDMAIRDGTMGSAEFRNMMRELRNEEVSIRNEVDDRAYDRYLFQSGQPNRISVDSVILGSAAEQNGIQPGDMILSYEGRPVYSHRDLRSATSSGERDELVNVTVLRDDNEMTVSMPRGPLGVRLSPRYIDPDEDA